MALTRLLDLIQNIPVYGRLLAELRESVAPTKVTLLDAAKPYLISSLYRGLKRPMLVLTDSPEGSRRLQAQVLLWSNSQNVRLFPERDSLPYQRLSSDAVSEQERLQVLSRLISGASGCPPLIVASATALRQKVTPYGDFLSSCHTVGKGTEIDPFELTLKWQKMGYKLENTVVAPGQMARRGGILDIFPPTEESPARLEFFGNTVEGIRLFDIVSQRSREEIDPLFISPAQETLAPFQKSRAELERILSRLDLSSLSPEMREDYGRELALILGREESGNPEFYAPLFNDGCLFDYLPEETLVILDEPTAVFSALKELDKGAQALFSEKAQRGEIPLNFPKPYFSLEEIQAKLGVFKRLEMTQWGVSEDAEINRFDFAPSPSYGGQLSVFVQKIKQFLREKNRLFIVSHQSSRLSELFYEADVIAPVLNEVREIPPPGGLLLLKGQLASGWAMGGKTLLFTDAEIFGFVKERRSPRRRYAPKPRYLTGFKPGEHVVHIEHGIARFLGVTRMPSEATEREYLVLQYAGGDKLYVPADQIDRVGRYTGGGEEAPALSRLGTQEWNRIKQRTKEETEAVARELLELYATREVIPGYVFSEDKVWQQELEASFPYPETPDQLKVIGEVKDDMMRDKPMDRLVCGDVGYGKTEIAVRAAFKAVLDGKQVAILVPTTVLAEQHLVTFRQRMEAFPLRIEVLSRFRSAREQAAVIKGLKNGSCDIVIGTHRLLQKDVAFKDLGLLVIDEEQRFGVSHKEYIKRLKKDVAVLTLSATPIPRTLHMSLVGVRNISMMETPPEDRLPVKSYVAEYDDRLVRDAVLRELKRNGQVFFVHNRVQSIAQVAARLKVLVPEARIAVAHGQMAEGELEMAMGDFVRGKYDVLVCTTIIESGLDMPNVNTLIVNHAEKFGLAQLYQLRGRVGRGSELAHAYFLFEREKRLTGTAGKRLRTILEASELGAGFEIAMKDLEIRGAGTLLGTRQSGFISAVGFDLYLSLLSQAIEDEKARLAGEPAQKEVKRLPQPGIDLPLKAFIPEDYVADIDTRLDLYTRLAGMDKPENVADVANELTDRFGRLPQPVKNLLYAVRVKILAAAAGIESITNEPGWLVLTPFEGLRFDRKKLEPFMRYGIQLGLQLRINTRRRLGTEWMVVLEEVLKKDKWVNNKGICDTMPLIQA